MVQEDSAEESERGNSSSFSGMVQCLHIDLEVRKNTFIIFYQCDIQNKLFAMSSYGLSVLSSSVIIFSLISRDAWEPGEGRWNLQQQQLQHWGLSGFLWTGQFLLPDRAKLQVACSHYWISALHVYFLLNLGTVRLESCYTLLYFTFFLCNSLGMPWVTVNWSGFFSKCFYILYLKSGSHFILSYSQMAWVMLTCILSTGSEKPTTLSY